LKLGFQEDRKFKTFKRILKNPSQFFGQK